MEHFLFIPPFSGFDSARFGLLETPTQQSAYGNFYFRTRTILRTMSQTIAAMGNRDEEQSERCHNNNRTKTRMTTKRMWGILAPFAREKSVSTLCRQAAAHRYSLIVVPSNYTPRMSPPNDRYLSSSYIVISLFFS